MQAPHPRQADGLRPPGESQDGMQMCPSGSLCTREPAAWGEICIIRIIRCRGRSLEDAAWISLSSRVSLLLSHVPDVTPAVRTVRRRCFSLASQPRAPLCSATAGASGSPSQGSSPQLDTRSEAPPPGGPARRLAQGPPGGLPGRGLRAAPPPATPAAASSSPAAGPLPVGEGGPGPGRGACGFGPSIPLSRPPPSGRCPPGAAWHPRPTPRSHPCAAQTGFAIPGVKS